MWSIKVLSGPHAGQTFRLKDGANTIGRASQSDIVIPVPGLSKMHAKILVQGQSVIIQDLNSTNGTYVNGVKIQEHHLLPHDKISLFDIILEIEFGYEEAPAIMPNSIPAPISSGFGEQGANALAFQPGNNLAMPSQPMGLLPDNQIKKQNYIEDVLLPGIYKLPETMGLQWSIGLLILAFVIIVTSLSIVPMIQITKSGIQKESQRRALTIAKGLAQKFQNAQKEGDIISFNIAAYEREEGVKFAYIISSVDGSIIAPVRKAGQSTNEPFIHTARKQDQQYISQLDDSTIGVAIPIKSFDNESGAFKTRAHSIILYDMGGLAIDTNRTLGLFIQVMAIALLIGFILYFFIYRMIEHPLREINKQMNIGLKDGQTMIKSNYQFPVLQDLLSNINTALSRMGSQGQSDIQPMVDRSEEGRQLALNYPSPAMTLDKEQNILVINNKLEELLGLSLGNIANQNYESLNDQALILNLKDLFSQTQSNGFQVVTSQLEFSSQTMKIILQPIQSDYGVCYYFISFHTPDAGGF